MKRRWKRWIAAMLAGGMMCMMGGIQPEITPEVAAPMTAEAAGATLEDEMAKFPQGKYWNHIGGSNNPDGYTDTPCTHHGSNTCSYTGSCGCNSFMNGIQCFAFARKVADDIYGQNPYSWSKDKNVSNLKAGDVMRVGGDLGGTNFGNKGGHSIIIVAVNGDQVTYGDCNGDGNKSCKILWDHVKTKAQMKSWMTGNGDGVFHAPYEAEFNSFVDVGDEFWALIMQPSSMKTMVVNTKGKLVLGSNQNKDETAGYWHFYRQDDGSYRIRSYYNNLFLSVDKDADENGAVLCVNEWAGGVSQDWWIYQNGDKFKFRPNTSADKVIDIDSGSQEDGAKCQIWHDTNAEQQWNYLVKVDPLDLGECFIAEITQESSGKPLVPNAKGTIVLGDSQNKDKSARWWRFTRNSDRTYSVQSIYNQQFLCVSNKSNENGAGIKTISWNGDKVHDWKIFGMGAGLLISPSYTYKALDIDSGSTADGTKVQLWNAENTGTQRLAVNKITPADYGKEFYAEIDQASSGKPLIVNASSNIVLGASQSGAKASQYWHFVQNADGSYQIQSYDTKNYLEAAGAKDEDGTLLVAKNSSSSQSWFIYDYGNMSTMIPSFSKTLKALDIDSGSTEDGTKVHLWTASKSDTQSIRINQKTQAEITEALTLKGDCNSDGKTNVTDLVLLQKWIMKVPKTTLKAPDAADMNGDGKIDIFDLALLKRKLLTK